MKYTKKPVTVEAIQWKGDNLREVIDLIGLHPSAEKWTWEEYEKVVKKDGLKVFNNNDWFMPSIGSMIIKRGENDYAWSEPDIFKQVFEREE